MYLYFKIYDIFTYDWPNDLNITVFNSLDLNIFSD